MLIWRGIARQVDVKSALVTGASGFVGQWLCRALLRDGWHVTGISLTPPIPFVGSQASNEPPTHFVTADLRQLDVAREVVRLAEAEVVFHLAGQSFVPAPGKDPIDGFSSNVGACVSLLAAVRDYREQGGNDPRVLVVGSAEQYGNCESQHVPIAEECPLRPATWYAGSKCAQEAMALAAFRADGLKTICTRSFNQAGPGQSQLFL
ncbi:MAG: NAD-dependent epimerase/dehydratase family protein, partial [Gemmatimonadota bacterium]|nr:NAD-dependent epimerase/dehydratase family protein [Gemmatimonadota bacterium]